MDQKTFNRLKPGDIIRHKGDRSIGYIVHANFGGRVTAARTVDLTNPGEWELVMESTHRLVKEVV